MIMPSEKVALSSSNLMIAGSTKRQPMAVVYILLLLNVDSLCYMPTMEIETLTKK